MNKLASLFVTFALATAAVAGPVSYSGKDKTPVAPAPPAGCQCFGPGAAFGVFGGGYIPNKGGDDVLGGGALAEYFFCENFGIQLSYGVYATHSEHHQIDGDLIFRMPIKSVCIAPYIMAGGGVATNSVTDGSFHAGAGIEARFDSWNCVGIFADGAYHWANQEPDFTIVRIGVKFPF